MSKVRIHKFEFIKDETGANLKYIEAAGPSSAEKPTAMIAEGSLFHETDTKKIYAYNEDNGWIEQMKLSEDDDTLSTASFSASPAVTRPSLQLNGGLGLNNALDLPDAEPEEIREEIPEDEIQEEPEEIQEEAEEEPGDAE